METIDSYYWLTIGSMLFAMLVFLRNESISDLVSIAAIIAIYASGRLGALYNLVYDSLDNITEIDATFLLIVIAIVFTTWLLPEIIAKLFFEKLSLKGLVSSIGTRLFVWIILYICIILYDLLYDNSTPFICSFVLPVIFATRWTIEIISKKDMTDENKDDYYTMTLVISVSWFLMMWCFNTMIGREAIVDAMGVDNEYHYTVSVALIPTIMLFLPVFLCLNSLNIFEIMERGEKLAQIVDIEDKPKDVCENSTKDMELKDKGEKYEEYGKQPEKEL